MRTSLRQNCTHSQIHLLEALRLRREKNCSTTPTEDKVEDEVMTEVEVNATPAIGIVFWEVVGWDHFKTFEFFFYFFQFITFPEVPLQYCFVFGSLFRWRLSLLTFSFHSTFFFFLL